MEQKKFILSTKKYTGNSGVVSVRLPNDLIKALDDIAFKTGRTRNDIIQKGLEFAIENIEIK